MGETLIADVESDGLLDTLTKLHSLQIGTADGDDCTIYRDAPGYPALAEGAARLKAADRVVFHNGMGFDLHAINRFFPGTIDPHKVFDTMVAARLLDPEADSASLEALGQAMGILKGSYTGDWQTFDAEMEKYARQDITVTRALYHKAIAGLDGWNPQCVKTEFLFAYVMALQEQRGFLLDVPGAIELEAIFRQEAADLTAELRDVFPPIWVHLVKDGAKTFTPKGNNRPLGYAAGCPFSRVKFQLFNPGSRDQVGKRLIKMGWRPTLFGKDGTPKLDDDILQALPWPQAKRLSVLFGVKKKLEQLTDGKSAWLKWVKPDGSVHGRVTTIGCAPGRCSHSKPNMAQVNKKDLRMRTVWKARPGWKLVGTDGEGLQARILASYLARYDGGAYARKITTGNKKAKTDEHSSNLKELPFLKVAFNSPGETFAKARDGAKTCLYCVLFGGQDPKLGRTLKEACKEAGLPVPRMPDRELGAMARQSLFRAIKGFQQLVAALREASKKRYLRGIDGRHIPVRSVHSLLVFLMQGGEAAVMKLAAVIFHFEAAPANGWVHGVDFGYVAHVHDEAQTEARPLIAEAVGKAYADCITEAGVRLGLKCPLAGSFSVGDTWAETH